MEEHSDIFSKLVKRKKPEVPAEFFKNFQHELNEKIDFTEQHNESVPAGFFENFHQHLMDEIHAEEEFKSLGLKKNKTPEIPQGYLENFAADILSKTNTKKGRGRILKITFWSTAAAVAAGFILLFSISTNEPESITEINPVVTEEEDFDTYAAYVDEESIIDYIVENDVDLGENDTDDDTYDFVNSDIEDIYLDLD
ncbi:MAG: hypothetical protein IPM77_12130 [Crocinitomicaceae bacterium]|nr:hypothetical protein [Crocinitomicaceae bacterium]